MCNISYIIIKNAPIGIHYSPIASFSALIPLVSFFLTRSLNSNDFCFHFSRFGLRKEIIRVFYVFILWSTLTVFEDVIVYG